MKTRWKWWKFRLNKTELLIATPLFVVWLARRAFDVKDYRLASGVSIGFGIPRDWEPGKIAWAWIWENLRTVDYL